MIRKLLLAIAVFVVSMGFAFAQIDVNKATPAELDSVKGIGPKLSQVIVAERSKGAFKNWPDLQKRVKGIGNKNAARFSQAGLTVGGKAY